MAQIFTMALIFTIAVGSLAFVETVKRELGMKTMHREVQQAGGTYVLRESSEAYGGEFAQENEVLRSENTIPWQKFAETTVDGSRVKS